LPEARSPGEGGRIGRKPGTDRSLRTAYWDDREARAAFKEFLVEIHGIDLSEWESRGYWDDAYTPFSYFEGGRIVSSVCIYSLEAVIDEREARIAQVSGVGTVPDLRRRGLNRRLTDVALEWAAKDHEGVFLFSNPGAIPFYEVCGFERIEEHVEFVEARPVAKREGRIKLDPGEEHDLRRIYAHADRRAPVSNRFAVLSARLLAFHALYTLRDCAYEIPALGCLIFLKREKGVLKIFDVVGERVPSWDEIHPFVAHDADRTVEFHFHTDRLRVEGAETRPLHGNHPFVRAPFLIERPVFPFTSRA